MVKKIKRKYPPQPVVAVGAVVLNNGNVLLVKRGKNPNCGEWSLPGGAVKVGESLREAIIREIKEETGLDISVGEPIEFLERIYHDSKNRAKYHYVLIDYCCEYVAGKLKPSTDITDARFVASNGLEDFSLNPATKRVIEKALNFSGRKKEKPPDLNEHGKVAYWNLKKAKWYYRAVQESDFSKKVMEAILPLIKGSDTVIDIGAGCGAMAIPLAEKAKSITALEPSKPMIKIIKKEALKRRLYNINFKNAFLGKVKLKPHDVVVLANVPGVLKNMKEFLDELEKINPRLVFLIHGADSKRDKFYFKELYPLILKKIFPEKNDYLLIYNSLHHFGIYANVKIIGYNLDQPFDSIDEAVDFWKEYLNLKSRDYDKKLKSFLKKRLIKTPYGLKAVVEKQSAIIWWERNY